MALSEIKTNVKKWDTDEPQTNGSYKIRQIIIKIIENTLIHTAMNKVKAVQQKQSTIDWPGEQRGPKIMSTRTKLTKRQTGKKKNNKKN